MGNAIPKQPNALKIGILGVARISSLALIDPAKELPTVDIVAVASRTLSKAQQFAKKHNIARAYGSYEELLKDKEIEAVYIPLPNSMHHEWSIKAMQSGKHVLCEKPLASNEQEALEMKNEAEKCKVVLVEAFHYRYHPLIRRAKEILDSGELGPIKDIKVQFCIANYLSPFISQASKDDIRFQYDLAGGITMDAGCYTVNCIRYLSGKEPKVIASRPELLSPQIDGSMEVDFEFDDKSTASMRASFRNPGVAPVKVGVDITCEKGKLYIYNFIVPHFYHYLTVETADGKSRTEKVYGSSKSTYYYQLEAFVNQLRGGNKCPTDPADSIGNMRTIDSIYQKAGLLKRGTPIDKTETSKPGTHDQNSNQS